MAPSPFLEKNIDNQTTLENWDHLPRREIEELARRTAEVTLKRQKQEEISKDRHKQRQNLQQRFGRQCYDVCLFLPKIMPRHRNVTYNDAHAILGLGFSKDHFIIPLNDAHVILASCKMMHTSLHLHVE